MNVKDTIFGLVILLLLLFVGYREFVRQPVVRTIERRDTIVQRDTIRIFQRGEIRYKKIYIERWDTIREKFYTEVTEDTSVWTACVDTSVKRTRVTACFFYPSRVFDIRIVPQADTIEKYIITERPIMKIEQSRTSWYVEAGKIGGSFLLGYILGRAK